MNGLSLLILLSIATMAMAAPPPNRLVRYDYDVTPEDAKAALVARGFAVKDVVVASGVNVIALDPAEARDPLPIIATIPTRASRIATLNRMKTLLAKGAKNLTPGEMDEVLHFLLTQTSHDL